MPSRRKAKGFVPLGQRPAPQTEAARQERALREREALELAREAAQIQMDRLRREQRDQLEADDPALPHFLPRDDQPDDGDWEYVDPPDRLDPRAGDNLRDDPILNDLEAQAKLLRRLKVIENWEKVYDGIFDEFLLGQEQTSHWATADWDRDRQPQCRCSAGASRGKLRKRDVVLVGLHSMSFVLLSSSLLSSILQITDEMMLSGFHPSSMVCSTYQAIY